MTDQHDLWDAVVVGSGATGATAARALTKGGLRVLVLEAGPPLRVGDYGGFVSNGVKSLWRHFVSRRQSMQEMHPTYWNTNPDFFVDDIENPYTTPEGMPFRWIRTRRVGGRTLVWDAVTPRFSDYDFKAAELDGYGASWPIEHRDLAPYYAELERILGVHGSREGLAQVPDGEFLEARPMTPAEKVFKERVEKNWGDRRVIPSRGLRAGRSPMDGSPYSRMSSPVWALEDAAATGRLTVRTGAVVARLLTEGSGAVSGLEFIDTASKTPHAVRARAVFLCASTIETLRILMNSRSTAHPDGVGASSGILGTGIMDHSAGNVYFTMPEVPDDGTPHDLFGSDSIMIPRYQNLGKQSESYLRGFGVWGGIQRLPVPRFLHKNPNIAFGFLCARSEVLPHPDNKVTVNSDRPDAWGIPSAHITCEWKPADRAIAEAGRLALLEMVEASGGKPQDLTDIFHTPFVAHHIRSMQTEWKLSTPGMFVHEVGGARMGTTRENSVVGPHNQVWDAPNVFVTDGACWPTSGWQNPTLTEMAITARACDFAVRAMARGEL